MIEGDPVVIGAGPAGLATAMQLQRYGVSSVVLEKDSLGGLLRNANLVENYPGFPDGIPGMQLVQLFEKQAQQAGIEVKFMEVKSVDYQDGFFIVRAGASVFQTPTLVVASGTKPRIFHDLFIPESVRERVYYEVYPLLQLQGKCIAVVGGGDAAFDYAMNLAKHNKVLILNRGQQLKCLPLLWERAQREPRIEYAQDTMIKEVCPQEPDGLLLRCLSPAGLVEYAVDYLIGAIGRFPQVEFLSEAIREQSGELQSQGVLFYIGDVARGIYRQTGIAVGDGILAAMKIYRYKKETHG